MLGFVLKILENPVLFEIIQGAIGQPKYRRKTIHDYLTLSAGMRILDIGCGPGYVSPMVGGCTYIGFDINQRYIDYANKKYGAYGRFFCEILTEERVADFDPFDVVMLNGVLHHVDDNTVIEILQLAHRALKSGGIVLSSDPCYVPNQHPIAKFLVDNDRGEYMREATDLIALAKKTFPHLQHDIRSDMLHVLPCTALIMKGLKEKD